MRIISLIDIGYRTGIHLQFFLFDDDTRCLNGTYSYGISICFVEAPDSSEKIIVFVPFTLNMIFFSSKGCTFGDGMGAVCKVDRRSHV